MASSPRARSARQQPRRRNWSLGDVLERLSSTIRMTSIGSDASDGCAKSSDSMAKLVIADGAVGAAEPAAAAAETRREGCLEHACCPFLQHSQTSCSSAGAGLFVGVLIFMLAKQGKVLFKVNHAPLGPAAANGAAAMPYRRKRAVSTTADSGQPRGDRPHAVRQGRPRGGGSSQLPAGRQKCVSHPELLSEQQRSPKVSSL